MPPVLVTVPNRVEEQEAIDTSLEGGVSNHDHLSRENGMAGGCCECSE